MQHFRNLTYKALRCKNQHCIRIHSEELVLICLRLTRNLKNAASEPLWPPPLPHSETPYACMMQARANSTMQSLHIYAEFVSNGCGIASFAVSWMPLAFKVSNAAISRLAVG